LPASVRLKLVEAAIEEYDRFRISRIEIDRKDTSFTIHTLQNFRKYENLPECELYYILGIDNLVDFHRWREPEKILKLARMVVIRRSDIDDREIRLRYKDRVTFLRSPIIDISATEIRNKIRSGVDVTNLTPQSVLKVIKEYELYRDQK